MRRHRRNRPVAEERPGKILTLFALMLPVLLGLVGLTVDGGLLMASHRQTQNAADAAALAAAMDKFRGASDATALATANTFVANNGLSGVTLALNGGGVNSLNIPPTQGPYAGDARFLEAIVEQRVPTSFIHVLGVNRDQRVVARAVAGFEPVASGEGAIVLDPTAVPGVAVSGQNTLLKVNGTVVVNSTGSGTDQYGNDVQGKEAITTVRTPSIVAQEIQSVGGIDILDNIRRYDPAYPPDHFNINDPDRPFDRLQKPVDDPLWNLPVPTSSNGVLARYPQYNSSTNTWTFPTTGPAGSISVGNGQTISIPPGIYKSISITGGTVTFEPGIYVLGVNGTGGGNALSINGGTVTGNGVMFYNTGSNYTPDGSSDAGTGENADPTGAYPPPKSGLPNFGSIQVNGGTVNMTPYVGTGSNDPFNGMLFYQRRWNTTTASVGGNSDSVNLTGTIYAKWARFQLAGQGQYNAQYIVGSLTISGNATVTIHATGKNRGRANQVFLVE